MDWKQAIAAAYARHPASCHPYCEPATKPPPAGTQGCRLQCDSAIPACACPKPLLTARLHCRSLHEPRRRLTCNTTSVPKARSRGQHRRAEDSTSEPQKESTLEFKLQEKVTFRQVLQSFRGKGSRRF
uniref:Uncharacterized protein n=1 Tax=Oryza meridionalis TaxID=40149 RepID=A0A0E0F3S8_9ORYZ